MQRFLKRLQISVVVLLWHGIGVLNDGNIGGGHSLSPSLKEGLYSSDSNVIILNEGNMPDLVYRDANRVWVVQFYNSWCGHCIHFVPTWKTLATDLRGWRKVVPLGAIDCSSGNNLRVCRQFDIVAYPSVLLIPADFQPGHAHSEVRKIVSRDKQAIKDSVLDYLSQPHPPVPLSWPNLKPLHTVRDLWEAKKEQHTVVVIVFEEARSTVGLQVILDLVDYPEILVGRMLKAEADKLGIVIKYPSVHQVTGVKDMQTVISGSGMMDSDRRRFVDKLLSMTHHLDRHGMRVNPTSQWKDRGMEKSPQVHDEHQHEAAVESSVKKSGQGVRVYMQDLEATLAYTFKREVAIHKVIQGPKLKALRLFVYVLAKYFPGCMRVMRYLQRLAAHLAHVTTLTGEAWATLLTDLQDGDTTLPDDVRWVGCQGSKTRYRGYPCGMWTLFHTLTVAVHQQTGQEVDAEQVLLAIRGYMQHFFGCQECSENFLRSASNLEKKIGSSMDAVLWLWAVHNKVNKRLHGDITEDPQHPKIPFPAARDCPECRPRQDSDSRPVPWWNPTAVLAFLLELYGKDSIILQSSSLSADLVDSIHKVKDNLKDKEKEDKEKAAEDAMDWLRVKQHEANLMQREYQSYARRSRTRMENGAEGRYLGTRSGVGSVSRVDIGLYVALYIVATTIVAILYFHLIFHRRHKTPFRTCLPM